VIFGRNFTEVSASLWDQAEWRTTIDTNVQGEYEGVGQVGVRYNGAYQETHDSREHSEGHIQFNQVNVAIAPTDSTLIQLLGEWGYREQPALLGYFSAPEAGAAGNGADVPLQITHDDIGWDWNWSTGNMRSLDTAFYRAQITQNIGEDLSINAYASYMSRVQVDSDGLDASGGGGSAASWDMGFSGARGGVTTGWINPNTPDEQIVMHYHFRDWENRDRSYGATALYKFDVMDTHHTVTAGGHFWREAFISKKGTLPEARPTPSSSTWCRAGRHPARPAPAAPGLLLGRGRRLRRRVQQQRVLLRLAAEQLP
jgi:hypothetical protein